MFFIPLSLKLALGIKNHFPRLTRTTIEGCVLNISSAIVYAKSEHEPALRTQLLQVTGVEVHASTDDGKMIITIESESDRTAVNTYEAIERMEGVLSVAMIFQQTESHPDQELLKCK